MVCSSLILTSFIRSSTLLNIFHALGFVISLEEAEESETGCEDTTEKGNMLCP